MTAVFIQGANYRSFGTVLSDTNETTVYTCPSGAVAAYVVWINITDTASNARTATIRWTDSSASATYSLNVAKAITANTVERADLFLALEPGDTIKVTASAATLHVVVTVHEVAGRRG